MLKNSEIDIKSLGKTSRGIRRSVLKMVYKAKASHVGSALSCVDILNVLYGKVLKYDTKNISHDDRDRFLLSKGHACTALYATLAEYGFFSKKLLDNYSEDGSIFMSHINSEVSGVEFSTGSLGHALPVAAGMALAAKNKNKKHKTFVLMSDGELNEGSNWEAIMMSKQLQLDNLIAILDINKIQALGHTKDVLQIEPIEEKFSVFGWDVDRINGHDLSEIYFSLKGLSTKNNGRPKALIADTVKGKGVSFMEGKLKWHYSSPNDDEYQQAVKELNE